MTIGEFLKSLHDSGDAVGVDIRAGRWMTPKEAATAIKDGHQLDYDWEGAGLDAVCLPSYRAERRSGEVYIRGKQYCRPISVWIRPKETVNWKVNRADTFR